MKTKVLFAAIAAIALTSCSNELDNVVNPDASLKAIEFKPLITRADAVETTADDFADFYAFGYKGGASNPTSLHFSGTMTKDDVWSLTRDDDAEGNNVYWPAVSNEYLYFYAVSPATILTNETVPTVSNGTVASVSVSVDGKTDILVAKGTGPKQYLTNNGTVTYTFEHALAQVKVSAKTESGLKIKISSIKLTGLNTSADLVWPTTDGVSASWNNGSGSSTTQYTYTAIDTYLTGAFTGFVTGGLMVLPTEEATGKIVVAYDVYNSSDVLQKSYTAEANLSVLERGNTYNYQLTVGSAVEMEVNFAVTDLAGWDEGTEGANNNAPNVTETVTE